MRPATFATLVWRLSGLTALALADVRGASPQVDFTQDIEPIITRVCAECHGPEEQNGQLRLDLKDRAFQGGFSGPVIIAGKPRESVLYQLISSADADVRMPLGQPPLSADEIEAIRIWIEQGAAWPDRPSGELDTHWAYVRPAEVTPPQVDNRLWVRNPVDAFILARLEQTGRTPSVETGRESLLRRLSLDLTGLPPSLEEVDAFIADAGPDAYERAVDRLLASPHYGERWATAWLDAARYADSNGYTNDRPRSMWLYRDWVINALNDDMPFDQFTIEQIAGDMLPEATVDQRVATGFYRNSMFNDEQGVDQQEARWNALVERVGTTATVWLGSTVACAQCHNHKYDPFSQKDFFAMLAFLENTDYSIEGEDHNRRLVEPMLDLATPEEQTRRESLERQIAEAKAPPVTIEDIANMENAAPKPDTPPLGDLLSELSELNKLHPLAMVMRERSPPGAPVTALRIRGSYLSPGETISAATPAVLHPLPPGAPLNRLTLARWLVAEDNPLVARVVVNRAWSQFFGRGLVETEDDFGTRGSSPSHPELLDWLAVDFQRHGWRMKHLHKTIVMSATYRQCSKVSPEQRQADPDNRLLARGPRFRLSAEFIRDVALASSGLLTCDIGGPSVFPPQPQLSSLTDHGDVAWHESQGPTRYRRALYTFWRRTALYPGLSNFDAPTREACMVTRTRSNTPLQALTLLNDATATEAAAALARRIESEGGPDAPSRATYAFRLCTGRRPSPEELEALVGFYHSAAEGDRTLDAAAVPDSSQGSLATSPGKAWFLLSQALLNLDETITKE